MLVKHLQGECESENGENNDDKLEGREAGIAKL